MYEHDTLEEQLSYEEQMDSLNAAEKECEAMVKKAEAAERLYKNKDFQKVFGEKALADQAYLYMSFLHVYKGEQKERTLQMLEGLSFLKHYISVQLALKEQSIARLREIADLKHRLDHPEEYADE